MPDTEPGVQQVSYLVEKVQSKCQRTWHEQRPELSGAPEQWCESRAPCAVGAQLWVPAAASGWDLQSLLCSFAAPSHELL